MPTAPHDFTALRRIGWPYPAAPEDADWLRAWNAHSGARPARIVEQHRSGYGVAEHADRVFRAESPPEWQRRPGAADAQERAAVGDWVLLEGSRIVALLPRRTSIKRGAAGEHYRQQVIAANIDTVFVVCGLDEDFNPRRIERYLLLVGGGGAAPVVVLTKPDLGARAVADAVAALSGLEAQGVPVRAVNAKDPGSVEALRPWLGEGRTAVLVGSSGAGKSTLTNTLLGTDRMKTGEVRPQDSRGRHTTTYRVLIALPGGGCLIDTPGMRELKPTGEEVLVDGGFADIEAFAAQCRFRDCAHGREPGCAVRAAVERGELEEARVTHYLKLRTELAGAAGQLAARLTQKAEARTHKPGGKAPPRTHPRADGRHGRP